MDLDSLHFALNYNLPYLKIPSAMLTNDELLIETAKSNLPVILSTGMSSLDEVDNAVNLLEKIQVICNNALQLLIPYEKEELNINIIKTFIERYDCTVGYSGHEYDLEPTVLAVALGAKNCRETCYYIS